MGSSSIKPIIVVGAGFAGATYARRIAENGYRVDVIDRRCHVAGNAHDALTPVGTRVHRYGPHLFHTNNARVVEWLRSFGAFVPYEHHVSAQLPTGGFAPLPICRRTINSVFDVTLRNEEEVRAFLSKVAQTKEVAHNAAEHLMAHIGRELTDLFFRPYTKKMWGLDLEEMDAAVVKRIPIRYDDEERYFPGDSFQLMPRDGYTRLVQNILDHQNIRVFLGISFEKSFMKGYHFCFNSMPIDEYFEFAEGPLPYRSIRFHHREEPITYRLGATTVVNFTDSSAFTRQTDWSLLPYHQEAETERKVVTVEEPCDYKDNGYERYYPVKTSDGVNEKKYAAYKAMSASEAKLRFIGRCGTYQYLDMHQVINQSLHGADAWLAEQ
jgi:UDP-galactopyranose mutase